MTDQPTGDRAQRRHGPRTGTRTGTTPPDAVDRSDQQSTGPAATIPAAGDRTNPGVVRRRARGDVSECFDLLRGQLAALGRSRRQGAAEAYERILADAVDQLDRLVGEAALARGKPRPLTYEEQLRERLARAERRAASRRLTREDAARDPDAGGVTSV